MVRGMDPFFRQDLMPGLKMVRYRVGNNTVHTKNDRPYTHLFKASFMTLPILSVILMSATPSSGVSEFVMMSSLAPLCFEIHGMEAAGSSINVEPKAKTRSHCFASWNEACKTSGLRF